MRPCPTPSSAPGSRCVPPPRPQPSDHSQPNPLPANHPLSLSLRSAFPWEEVALADKGYLHCRSVLKKLFSPILQSFPTHLFPSSMATSVQPKPLTSWYRFLGGLLQMLRVMKIFMYFVGEVIMFALCLLYYMSTIFESWFFYFEMFWYNSF